MSLLRERPRGPSPEVLLRKVQAGTREKTGPVDRSSQNAVCTIRDVFIHGIDGVSSCAALELERSAQLHLRTQRGSQTGSGPLAVGRQAGPESHREAVSRHPPPPGTGEKRPDPPWLHETGGREETCSAPKVASVLQPGSLRPPPAPRKGHPEGCLPEGSQDPPS